MTKQRQSFNRNNRNGSRRRQNRGNGNNNNRVSNKPGGNQREGSGRYFNRSFLPPASLLQEYEYASHGAVEKILTMAREEQKHRQEWEKAYFKAQVRSQHLGQACGFVIALAIIVASWNLAFADKELVATALAGGGLFALGMSSLFSVRRRKAYLRHGDIHRKSGRQQQAPQKNAKQV